MLNGAQACCIIIMLIVSVSGLYTYIINFLIRNMEIWSMSFFLYLLSKRFCLIILDCMNSLYIVIEPGVLNIPEEDSPLERSTLFSSSQVLIFKF